MESLRSYKSESMDDTLAYLRRVEVMKRTNRLAAAQCRARHICFWFAPTTLCIGTSVMLSIVNAAAATAGDGGRAAVSILTAVFLCVAIALGPLQTRYRWGNRAEVHRSVAMELDRVRFQLEKLWRTGWRSSTSSERATRELYRIEIYLQALHRRMPDVPGPINAPFYLLGSRLNRVYRHHSFVVKLRSVGIDDVEESKCSSSSRVAPLEMQIEAMDVMCREIEGYFLYPLFMPVAVELVSRTIDAFLVHPKDGASGGETVDDVSSFDGVSSFDDVSSLDDVSGFDDVSSFSSPSGQHRYR